MTTLLAQIAPQRNTQYADLVTQLAPHELALSEAGQHIMGDIAPITLGNQAYLKFEHDAPDEDALLQSLGYMAMTDAYFRYYDQIGEVVGPLLKPIAVPQQTVLPANIVEIRRYRGKTNELFTQFMCNVARFSSDFRDTSWDKLTLLDPLAGGGTTLFVGMMLGADVAGVETDKNVVDGTVTFLKRYMKEGRISAKFRVDKLKNVGKRWFVTINTNNQTVRCVVGRGDARDVADFVHGLKRPQLVVTDLPYNIQHSADWQALLVDALPTWAQAMSREGALVFSWNATRFGRDEMIALVEEVSDFRVLNAPPYNQLGHQVDRVIKQRDVIVARL